MALDDDRRRQTTTGGDKTRTPTSGPLVVALFLFCKVKDQKANHSNLTIVFVIQNTYIPPPLAEILSFGSGVPHGPPARKPLAFNITPYCFILHPGKQDGATLNAQKLHQNTFW